MNILPIFRSFASISLLVVTSGMMPAQPSAQELLKDAPLLDAPYGWGRGVQLDTIKVYIEEKRGDFIMPDLSDKKVTSPVNLTGLPEKSSSESNLKISDKAALLFSAEK